MQTEVIRVSDLGAHGSQNPRLTAFHGKELYTPIWQSAFWNSMLFASGYESEGFFVRVNSDLGEITSWLEKRSIGLGKFALFCIGGPIGSGDFEGLKEVFSNAVESLGKKEGVVFVQLEPLSKNINFPLYAEGSYKRFIEERTLMIDLRVSGEEVLSGMKEKGRYNIRLAQKRGVTVKAVESSEENLSIFMKLLRETLSRDGFSGNSASYYRSMLGMLWSENIGGLYFAYNSEGEVVAGAIASFYGNTGVYYYGASTSDATKRRDMPAYLLQWEMILEAKRRGCEFYDFLGIAPNDDPSHHLAGVTDFKRKFGGFEVVWPESQIRIFQPFWYRMISLLRMVSRMRK